MRSLRFLMAVTALTVACPAFSAPTNVAQYDLAIERQPLSAALQEFAKQSGVQIIFFSKVTDGYEAPSLKGKFTAADALQRLLNDSALTFLELNEKTIEVQPKAALNDLKKAREGVADTAMSKSEQGDALRLAQSDAASSAGNAADNGADGNEGMKLEEIVVTAQKRDEKLQDVPISIAVLSGKDLDQSTVSGTTEALSRVPGVSAFAHYSGGGTMVTMRGVTASGPVFGGSSPVAYYLDSVPFGLVKTAFAPDANAYDLQRVEVLRGPQGTLYGANAQNGVVRVLTNDANLGEFEFKARGSLSGTENGGENYRGDMALNVPIVAEKLAARAVVGYQDWSGWIDRPAKKDLNDAELLNARFKINARPIDALAITAFMWLSRNDYGGQSTADDDGRVTAVLDQPLYTDYDAYGLKISYELPGVSINSSSSYLTYATGGDFDLFPAFGLAIPFFTGFDADVLTQEVILNSRSEGPWRWIVGGIYRDAEDQLVQQSPDPFAFGIDWGFGSKSYAAFGELSRRFLGDRLEWTLGLRYFHDDVFSRQNALDLGQAPGPLFQAEGSFDATTPRAVLTWHPSHDVTLYGSYSEGFRSGFSQDPSVVQVAPGFPAIKPDKLRNYEIGAKSELLENSISLEAALYYIDWQDVQQQLSVNYNGIAVTANVNAPSASGMGLDFGITARPTDGLTLGATVSWNDLTVDSDVMSSGAALFAKGDRLNFSPEYTVGTSADYVFPIGGSGLRGELSISGNYTAEQSFRTILGGDPTQSIPGAQSIAAGDSMLLARASFAIDMQHGWKLTLFADNVTDEGDSIYGNPFIQPLLRETFVRVRPRTIGMQFDYRY